MNKKQSVFSVIIGIAVIIAGYFVYEHLAYVETDNAQVIGPSVMLAPKVSGYVIEVNITEGQKVTKGDVLIKIDPRDYENTLKQTKGELASVEAKKRDAEKNYKRLTDLYSNGAVSQQQFDNATTQFNDFKAKYDAIASQVAQAELNLANTQIKAPTDGVIAKKSVELGQLAAPGIPLIGFVDSSERWVVANFKETEIEDVKIGANVDIKVDAISGKTFKGKVESMSSATGATFTLLPPDNATGNFTKVVQRVPVKILFNNISAEDIKDLKTGLSAIVKVHRK